MADTHEEGAKPVGIVDRVKNWAGGVREADDGRWTSEVNRITWRPAEADTGRSDPALAPVLVAQEVMNELRAELSRSDDPCGFLLGRPGVASSGRGASASTRVQAMYRAPDASAGWQDRDVFARHLENSRKVAARHGMDVVGWYHTHRNFGARLTRRDRELHRSLFPRPGPFALVLVGDRESPAGGFLQLDHESEYGRTRLLPFCEVVDPERVTPGEPLPTCIDWQNYDPDVSTVLLEPGDSEARAVEATPETGDGRPAVSSPAAEPDVDGRASGDHGTASAGRGRPDGESEPEADTGETSGAVVPASGGGDGGSADIPAVAPPGGWMTESVLARSGRAAAEGILSDLLRLRHVRVLWDRRRTFLAVVGFVVLAVTVGTLLQTPIYRATALVEIRKQSGEGPTVGSVLALDRIPNEYLETQYGIFRSRELARRAVLALGPAALPPEKRQAANFTAAAGVAGDGRDDEAGSATSDTVIERAVRRFQRRLVVDPVSGSWLVRVGYEHSDPELASKAVNTAVEEFADLRVDAAEDAVQKLSRQLDSARTRLVTAERQLQEYTRRSGLLPFQGDVNSSESLQKSRIQQLQDHVTAAEADRYAKESRYEQVRRGSYDFLDSQVLRSLSVQASELKSEYARVRATFKEDYPRAVELKRQLDAVEEQLRAERRRIAAELLNEYSTARLREEFLREALNDAVSDADRLSERSTEYRILKQDVEGHRQLYTLLQERRQEARVALGLATAELSVIDPAVPPSSPENSSPLRNVMLAVLAGGILGAGVVFGQEYMNPAVRTVDEMHGLTEAPVLGVIPTLRRPEKTRSLPVESRSARVLDADEGEPVPERGEWYRIDRPELRRSALADAFSGLRTSVILNGEEFSPVSMLVTSARQAEGKTTISVNLALSLARLDKRVLLVDADLRRPSIHRSLGLPESTGLAEHILDVADWRTSVLGDVLPGVDVLPAGSHEEDPGELLSMRRMEDFLREAEATYEFVIVDSPALLMAGPDARIIARLADAAVMVVRRRVTPRAEAQRALEHLPTVIGVVLNDFDVVGYDSYE